MVERRDRDNDFFIKVWDITTGKITDNLLTCHEEIFDNKDADINKFASCDFLIRINDHQFANVAIEGHYYSVRISECNLIIYIWDIKHNSNKKIMFETWETIECLMKVDNEHLAVGFTEEIKIMNILTEQIVFTLSDSAIRLLNYNNHIVSRSLQKEIKIWDKNNKKVQQFIEENYDRRRLNELPRIIMMKLKEYQFVRNNTETSFKIEYIYNHKLFE